jgi:hypothetical protein
MPECGPQPRTPLPGRNARTSMAERDGAGRRPIDEPCGRIPPATRKITYLRRRVASQRQEVRALLRDAVTRLNRPRRTSVRRQRGQRNRPPPGWATRGSRPHPGRSPRRRPGMIFGWRCLGVGCAILPPRGRSPGGMPPRHHDPQGGSACLARRGTGAALLRTPDRRRQTARPSPWVGDGHPSTCPERLPPPTVCVVVRPQCDTYRPLRVGRQAVMGSGIWPVTT